MAKRWHGITRNAGSFLGMMAAVSLAGHLCLTALHADHHDNSQHPRQSSHTHYHHHSGDTHFAGKGSNPVNSSWLATLETSQKSCCHAPVSLYRESKIRDLVVMSSPLPFHGYFLSVVSLGTWGNHAQGGWVNFSEGEAKYWAGHSSRVESVHLRTIVLRT